MDEELLSRLDDILAAALKRAVVSRLFIAHQPHALRSCSSFEPAALAIRTRHRAHNSPPFAAEKARIPLISLNPPDSPESKALNIYKISSKYTLYYEKTNSSSNRHCSSAASPLQCVLRCGSG